MSQSTLGEYKNAGKAFFNLIEKSAGFDFNDSLNSDEWPISKIVHHLFDAEVYFVTRYMNILVYQDPAIILFDEELLPKALQYDNRSLENSVKGLQGLHAVMEDLLSHISAADWEKTGLHPEMGSISLSQVLAQQTAHILDHTNQINKIIESGK